MNRKRRTKILIEGNISLVKPIIDNLKKEKNIVTVEEPNTGLVMVKMRDSAKKQLFYLGEVLVTEAKVKIDNCIGLGIVKGKEKDLAYDLAIIDALAKNNFSGNQELKNRIFEMEVDLEEKRKKEIAILSKTKVDFETVDEEIKA